MTTTLGAKLLTEFLGTFLFLTVIALSGAAGPLVQGVAEETAPPQGVPSPGAPAPVPEA